MDQMFFNNPKNLNQTVCDYFAEEGNADLQNVVAAGTPLVRYYAYLYCGGEAPDDFIQAGFEGLLKALKRFDPIRGVSFTTFAVYYISGEMLHYIRNEASFDRPKWIADLQKRIYKSIDRLTQANQRSPELHEIANDLNIREEGIKQALRARWTSLDELDCSEIKHLRYENFQLPIEDRILISQALDSLNEIQKKVLYLTFYQDYTQAEVGEKLGIGQRRVSRVLNRGLQEIALYLA